jgi:hypothetical protein
LHHLFDRFGHRAHAGTPRGDRGHATNNLQAFGKTLRVTIDVTIEASERHGAGMIG